MDVHAWQKKKKTKNTENTMIPEVNTKTQISVARLFPCKHHPVPVMAHHDF